MMAKLIAPDRLLDGTAPKLRIVEATPHSTVRLHALRQVEKWQFSTQWERVKVGLHAFADFLTDTDGCVDVDSATPLHGTHHLPDPLALFFAGKPLGDVALTGTQHWDTKALKDNEVLLCLEAGEVQQHQLYLESHTRNLTFSEVWLDACHGVLAVPPNPPPVVVIALHGSEGGSTEKAQHSAAQFASLGFPCLALSYFAYPHEAIRGVPTQHLNIPLEHIPNAKAWLTSQLGEHQLVVYGMSKGAEFALLAASHFTEVDGVVAVVPSDVVWEGYTGASDGKGEASSWSLNGQPLPYIPLFPFDPSKEGLYHTNTLRYSRSRQRHAHLEPVVRIPIEQSHAKLLLLAGDKDEVWASGEMSRNVVEQMILAGKGAQVTVKIYPDAGHQLSGTGTFPIWLYGKQEPHEFNKNILSEGYAAADAWRRTVAFLRGLLTNQE
jgi:dienelactone hydrolase